MAVATRQRPTPTLPSTRKPLPAPLIVQRTKQRGGFPPLLRALLLLIVLIGLSLLLGLSSRLLPPRHADARRSSGRASMPRSPQPPSPSSSPPSPSSARLPACTTLTSIGQAACLPRRLLFVGGLQRSGTSTLAALLDGLPGVSGLRFDALNPVHMEAAPWKRLVDVHTGTWMKWAYFKEVISTGGAEGKLLQHVFPYRYAVWDAKFAKPEALLAHPSALSPLLTNASREELWLDWRRFWGAPAATLVDKSPENILMAPFLQALFGKERTSFVFVMRHPLCWALVAAKWGCIWQPLAGQDAYAADQEATSQTKAPTLECLTHLVDVWLAVHEQLVRQLPGLSEVQLLPAESDAWLRDPSWLAQMAARGSIPASPPSDAVPTWASTQDGFRDSSHGYVHCFLQGFAPRRTRVTGGGCHEHGALQARHAERMAWLRHLDARVGTRVRALGYTMNLSRVASQCCTSTWEDWRHRSGSAPEERGGQVVATQQLWSPDSPSAYERHADGAEGCGLHAGGVALIISSSFLSAFNGMQQRAAQLAMAVGKLGYAVHFVSLGPLNSTEECATAVPPVICHATGDSTAQYSGFLKWARAARATPSLVVLGFTSLTLEVSRALLRLPKSSLGGWRNGQYDQAHVRKAHQCVQLLDQSIGDFPTAATIVFTDDIHFQRTQHVLALAGRTGAPSPPHARVLSIAKQFELRTYAKARLVVLISEEDERTLATAMPSLRTTTTQADATTIIKAAGPATAILPFGATPLSDEDISPMSNRVRGRMLFVGTCHPVARASVTWLVRTVLPRIVRLATAAGQATALQLRIAGNGWAHLASEAPFAEWVDRGNVIMLGKLSDEQLAAEYQSSRLFVSPLLNATGIATKNFHAMAKGLPVLTTRMGAAGLLLPDMPIEPCCSGGDREEAKCQMSDAFSALLGIGAPILPRRPTLLEDCRTYPSRMECKALAAARGLPRNGTAVNAGRSVSSARGRGKVPRGTQTGAGRKLLALYDAHGRSGAMSLHRSGAMLIAESPRLFAEAVIRVIGDDALWQSVSRYALRHQRLLSPALQSGVLARHLAGGEVQLRLPAERACVVVCDRCEAGRRRDLLRTVLAALLQLRIACHVVLLPQTTQPAAEARILGWLQTQGVFFYSGTAREQWTALLAASPHPPVSFAAVLPDASTSRASLQLLQCVSRMPTLLLPPRAALEGQIERQLLADASVVLARDASHVEELTRSTGGGVQPSASREVLSMPTGASAWSHVIARLLGSEER